MLRKPFRLSIVSLLFRSNNNNKARKIIGKEKKITERKQ